MKVDFTDEMMFSFPGPNLCLLGDENDFKKLAESILVLMDNSKSEAFELLSLDFTISVGEKKNIIFSSKNGSNLFGGFNNTGDLIFELDPRVWERLFRYLVLMSWYKRTYYLNIYEDCLDDLDLFQECHFICSSEF